MIFWMLPQLTPKSLAAVRQRTYRQALRDAAKEQYSNEPSIAERLYARVVWFSRKKGGPDTDNILKPILDELDGIVYGTDAQITQCLATRVDLNRPYEISDLDRPDELYQRLLDLISLNQGDILYVEIGEVTSQRVSFGQIDWSTR